MEYTSAMDGICLYHAWNYAWYMHEDLSKIHACFRPVPCLLSTSQFLACSSTESWNMHGSCTLCTTEQSYIHAWNNVKFSAWNVLQHAWNLHASGTPFGTLPPSKWIKVTNHCKIYYVTDLLFTTFISNLSFSTIIKGSSVAVLDQVKEMELKLAYTKEWHRASQRTHMLVQGLA